MPSKPSLATRWNTPTRPDFDRHVRVKPNQLARYADAFDDIGCAILAADIRAALAAADQLTARADEGDAHVTATRARLVEEIATGATDAHKAAAALADARRTADVDPVAGELLNAARHSIIRSEVRRLYTLGDDLVTKHLDVAVQTTVDAITKAAAKLGTITRDEDLTREGAPAREAWFTITNGRAVIDRCHRLAQRLRTDGLVSDLPGPPVPAEWWRWANVSVVIATPRAANVHANVRLIDLITRGAAPKVLTAREVVALYLASSA